MAQSARAKDRDLKAVPDIQASDVPTTPARRGAAQTRGDLPRSAVDEERIAQLRQRQVALIGKRIRELRRNRLTLSELAKLSQVSVGLLSRLENGIGNPQFAALNAIARALDVDVYTFFQSPDTTAKPLRRGERTSVLIQNTGVELELLTPTLAAAQQVGLVTVLIHLPREQTDSWVEGSATSRMQLEVILKGSVSYEVESEQYRLDEGDSIMFDASRRHRRTNPSRTDTATIFSVSRDVDFL